MPAIFDLRLLNGNVRMKREKERERERERVNETDRMKES